MEIKDFLENFNGSTLIRIYDGYDFSTYNYIQEAISSYGCSTVKSWNIVDNILKITIQSQFY